MSLTAILASSCAAPTPSPDFCASLSIISPDPGFQARWTTAEKQQVDAYDRFYAGKCGR